MVAGKECRVKLVRVCFRIVVGTKPCSYSNRNDSGEEEIHDAGERRGNCRTKVLE